jgi:hypothetical protein
VEGEGALPANGALLERESQGLYVWKVAQGKVSRSAVELGASRPNVVYYYRGGAGWLKGGGGVGKFDILVLGGGGVIRGGGGVWWGVYFYEVHAGLCPGRPVA